MADYARRGDQAQWMANQARQTARMRTARPRRGAMPALSWAMEGPITLDRFFLPTMNTIDPLGDGVYPEHKQIVAVDGWLHSGGNVLISWQANDSYFYEEHLIVVGESGQGNRIWFDGQDGRPTPFIIENGDVFSGEFPRPEIQEEPAFPALHLACFALYETVPI